MSKQVKIDLKELENFLQYLQDKVDQAYSKETERAIQEYLKDIGGIDNGKTN